MNTRHLSKLVFITLVAVYLLIFIGSMVRSTGAGMGCPDWPTCFGKIIPPTSVEQLPQNYKTLYPFYQNTQFNPIHTWTEYFNRLAGVSIGFLMLIAWVYSLIYRKQNKKTAIALSLAFFITAFQGWIGSVVVSTHLSPLIISLHMVLAQIITLILVYAYVKSLNLKVLTITKSNQKWLYSAFLILIIQMLFGLKTRGAIDEISNAAILNPDLLNKDLWVSQLPLFFDFHRIFSIVSVFFLSFASLNLLKCANQNKKNRPIKNIALGVLLVVFILFIVGISLVRFDFPFFLQPVHLLLASLLLGLCFSLVLLTSSKQSH